MTKADLNILNQAFVEEMRGLLFQCTSKQVKKLAEQGYLEPVTKHVGQGWPQVTCAGYQLTHKGRIAYCERCEDPA